MNTGTETRVEAVMTTPVETISANASIREAATMMRAQEINSLLVPGAEVGIITSTDVLDVVVDGHDPEQCSVAEVMTGGVEWVSTDLRLQEAAAMMENFGINHLLVRDADGDYVGLVSSTDIRDVFTGPARER